MKELYTDPELGTLIRRLSRLTALPRNGFTLIEVVLVLAIGALIFLVAFTAFSQVQKNRRDSQRRQDARSMLAYIEEFATNNGQYPCGASGYFNGYLQETGRTNRTRPLSHSSCMGGFLGSDERFGQPSGDSPTYTAYNDPSTGPGFYSIVRNRLSNYALGRMAIYVGARCSDGTIAYLDSSSTFAVRLRLENNSFFCVDNAAPL